MTRPPVDFSEFAYEALPSLPEADLLGSESCEWAPPANLDDFLTRIYRYYEEKGFAVIAASRILNLLALGFTVAFSAGLLLLVDWRALRAECVLADTCDISQVAFNLRPWEAGPTFRNCLAGAYLAIFAAYWAFCAGHTAADLLAFAEIRRFTTRQLGLSERQLQTVTWPEVAARIVQAQRTTRLCLARDLTEHDVVSRIMRRENYLIGMLNRGVLALHVPLPGGRRRLLLTKTLEWNLQWCLLGAMFDEGFRIRPEFLADPRALSRRLRLAAVVNLALAPFVLVFLLIYFFLRNAERFYHSPSALGARSWSPLAAWRLREFNELPYCVRHRLDASHRAAERYLAQFPSPLLSAVAQFVAFIAGSFAALLLGLTLAEDDLLERHFCGRNLVWWAATLGIVLAASRAFIAEPGTAFEPELALAETVAHTHYLPRHWRGRAHTREVQTQFQQLFQFKAVLFLEEMASILLTPFILWFSLPKCAPAVVQFVRDSTAHVPGVGDVCSLAAFQLQRHGNAKYGSPFQAPKGQRSRQGKMEKSLVSFVSMYPSWQPDAAAKQLLAGLAEQGAARGPHFPYTAHLEQLAAAGVHGGGAWRPAEPQLAASRGLHGIFHSAELPPAGTLLAASMRPLSEAEWRVADGQRLVQSFYEERDRAIRRGTPHHSLRGDESLGWQREPPEPGGRAGAAASAIELGTVPPLP